MLIGLEQRLEIYMAGQTDILKVSLAHFLSRLT